MLCYPDKWWGFLFIFTLFFTFLQKYVHLTFQECHSYASPGFAGGIFAGLENRWKAGCSAHDFRFAL